MTFWQFVGVVYLFEIVLVGGAYALFVWRDVQRAKREERLRGRLGTAMQANAPENKA